MAEKNRKVDNEKSNFKLNFHVTKIDDWCDFLHYRCTTILLIGISGVLMSYQFYFKIIQCSGGYGGDMDEAANLYCLMHSTYTVPKSNPAISAHPGLPIVRLPENGGGQVVRHRYYLWIQYFLFILGLFFYLPRYIWKSLEQGKIYNLTSKLNKIQGHNAQANTLSDYKTVESIAEYFVNSKGLYNWYFCEYLVVEILYMLNVIFQTIWMDYFFGNEFSDYGLKVFTLGEQDPETRVDRFEAIFPKVTKCNFDKYGHSGNIQHFDFVCLLPLNVINEKVFIFIWWWLLFLSVITLFWNLNWVFFVSFSNCRLRLFLRDEVSAEIRKVLQDELAVSDFFLLYLLKLNLNAVLYDYFLYQVCVNLIGNANSDSEDLA